MTKRDDTSRREFIGLALSTAALSSLSRRELFANGGGAGPSMQETAQREIPPLVDSPGWKEQGVENLTKSRYAKLRNVPVRAVTIKTGFWGRRRETNVSKSIPTMHDLLEANGRMMNFRRLRRRESRHYARQSCRIHVPPPNSWVGRTRASRCERKNCVCCETGRISADPTALGARRCHSRAIRNDAPGTRSQSSCG